VPEAYGILVGKPEGKKCMLRWEDNINIDPEGDGMWIGLI
jgi:hypothetical protein